MDGRGTKLDEKTKQATSVKDIINSSKPNTFRDKSMRALRQLAEKILKEKTGSPVKQSEALSPEESQRVIHELKVHQIELEAQNEELRESQVALDRLHARYFDLYDLTPSSP